LGGASCAELHSFLLRAAAFPLWWPATAGQDTKSARKLPKAISSVKKISNSSRAKTAAGIALALNTGGHAGAKCGGPRLRIAVLSLPGTAAARGHNFYARLAAELFGQGNLDRRAHSIHNFCPDAWAREISSPATGLHRFIFRNSYEDMVAAPPPSCSEKVWCPNTLSLFWHLHGLHATSSCGEKPIPIFSFLWTALMPLACQPGKLAGRNLSGARWCGRHSQ